MHITANELKKRGATALTEKLQDNQEVFINIRGKNVYVALKIEDYNRFREYELENAIRESQADLESGNYSEESVSSHIQSLTIG